VDFHEASPLHHKKNKIEVIAGGIPESHKCNIPTF